MNMCPSYCSRCGAGFEIGDRVFCDDCVSRERASLSNTALEAKDRADALYEVTLANKTRLEQELTHALASEKQLNGFLKDQIVRSNKFEAENIRLRNVAEAAEAFLDHKCNCDVLVDQGCICSVCRLKEAFKLLPYSGSQTDCRHSLHISGERTVVCHLRNGHTGQHCGVTETGSVTW